MWWATSDACCLATKPHTLLLGAIAVRHANAINSFPRSEHHTQRDQKAGKRRNEEETKVMGVMGVTSTEALEVTLQSDCGWYFIISIEYTLYYYLIYLPQGS